MCKFLPICAAVLLAANQPAVAAKKLTSVHTRELERGIRGNLHRQAQFERFMMRRIAEGAGNADWELRANRDHMEFLRRRGRELAAEKQVYVDRARNLAQAAAAAHAARGRNVVAVQQGMQQRLTKCGVHAPHITRLTNHFAAGASCYGRYGVSEV